MFWGVVLQGNKTHSHLVEDTYQVSQAALEPNSKSVSSSPDLVSVWVKSEEGDEYLLCTLEHGKTWQSPVSLLALEGSEMAYLVKGDGKIHLTGCLVPEDDEFDDFEGMEDEELSDEEELDTSNGEIDARNVINGKRAALALPPADSPAKKMKSEAGKAVANQSAGQKKDQPKANGAKAPNVEEEEEEDEEDEEDEEMENNLGKLLAGADDDDDDDEDDEDMDDEEDEEDEDEEDEEVEKLGKQQLKNNLSKKTPNQQKGKGQGKQESNITPKQKQTQFGGEQKKRTPGPGKNHQQGSHQQGNHQQGSHQQGNRSFGGGSNKKPGFNKQGGGQKGGSPFGNQGTERLKQLEIIDQIPGYGPPAVSGRMVHVSYVGRLNGSKKEFDRNKSGFSFRLGKGEVIEGWEKGVEKMKVGGKRIIRIPASLAYGSKATGPIPPNSDLEFEVQLRAVTK